MSKPPANFHDAFFKQALSDPDLAGRFLREHLPEDLVELLCPEAPEPIPGSFVDEELREHHSDLLFRLRLRTGGNAFVYLLLEHKSCQDQAARLQLLRYVVRMLIDWYKQNKEQLPLPAVLPLLAHQGPGNWKFSCEFVDLFGPIQEPLRRYLPSFQHALVDLPLIDDRKLSTQARLRAFLMALKYMRRPDFADCIDVVLAEALGLEKKDFLVILTYLDKRPGAINHKVIHEALGRLAPDRKEKIMGWITQPYYDKGKAEGRAEGEAKLLSRFLEKRFGVVPSTLRDRLYAADVNTIEKWAERAFDAPDLQSVFESN